MMTGAIDVADHNVRLAVRLPWVLRTLAEKAKALIERQGHRMLESAVSSDALRSPPMEKPLSS
jgi:hypothetical protein